MTNHEILEMLEKQLQLLSERSKGCLSDGDLAKISEAMISLSECIWVSQPIFELPNNFDHQRREDCDNNAFDDTQRGPRYIFTFLGSFLGVLIGMFLAGLFI